MLQLCKACFFGNTLFSPPTQPLRFRTFSCEHYNLKDIVVGCFSFSALKIDGLDLLSDREFFIKGKDTNNFEKHSNAIHESKISLSYSSFYNCGAKKK